MTRAAGIAIRTLLGRLTRVKSSVVVAQSLAASTADRIPGTLRVMTYNVHSCVGIDRQVSIQRIAEVIASCSPDLVCLQELDVRRVRTGAIDQVLAIAESLEMEFHFHPALSVAEESYGDAVLSPHPLKLIRSAAIPGLPSRPHLEPRGALWVAVEIDGQQIQLFNTHLGLVAQERQAQIDALLGSQWLGSEACQGPTIFCGDLNALARSQVCRKLRQRLRDAQLSLPRQWSKKTFPSRWPLFRIDYVFISSHFEVLAAHVPREPLVRNASDHLPLVVDLKLRLL